MEMSCPLSRFVVGLHKARAARMPGLRGGVAQAFGRAAPALFAPHLTHDNVVYHHTDPITLLDDGDVDPNGLTTGNRSARNLLRKDAIWAPL
jgi:hypothetical protein